MIHDSLDLCGITALGLDRQAKKGSKLMSLILFGVQILAPISMEEVPIIRCMGLNYRDHALEANMPIPDTPVVFFKPRTALNGPHPAKINIPKIAQDGSSDYEAELTIILSKTGRDIPEQDAMDYVLGYTSSNDVSARTQQWKNSQWSFSKGVLYRYPPN